MSTTRPPLGAFQRWAAYKRYHRDVLDWALRSEVGITIGMYRSIEALAELTAVLIIGGAGLTGEIDMTIAVGAISLIVTGPKLLESWFIRYVLSKNDTQTHEVLRDALDDVDTDTDSKRQK